MTMIVQPEVDVKPEEASTPMKSEESNETASSSEGSNETPTSEETPTTTPTEASTSLTASPEGNENRKSVRFDKVYVHEHHMTLGCNPAVTDGPPVEISWRACRHVRHSVDNYEAKRVESPRARKDLRLTMRERREILQSNGISRDSMEYEEEKVKKIQKSRDAVEDEWIAESHEKDRLYRKMKKQEAKEAKKKPSKGAKEQQTSTTETKGKEGASAPAADGQKCPKQKGWRKFFQKPKRV